ncbi:hypothetical protein chiPu_0017618 [Chiloscyllium punctatum]|uniref:Uncharacterized protein n=1 Tax=Chiloscyllium punctatum TaxID=137246 RepID=A0A401RHI0_CHIPU|nr:hypothetical protein [Chiloscyllium punctatum]
MYTYKAGQPQTGFNQQYASTRNSSLCIPKLEVQIPSTIVRKRKTLEMSSDVITQASFQYRGECNKDTVAGLRDLKEIEDFLFNSQSGSEGKWTHIQAIMPALQEMDAKRQKPPNRYAEWREWEFEKWLRLEGQGADIQYFRDNRISNSWLKPAIQLKSSGFINSLLLQSNLYLTSAILSRGRPNRNKTCGRRETAVETISHVSGCCPSVKNARIKCHNKIADQLRKHVSKHRWTSQVEPRLFAKGGSLWKPDLIFKKDQKIAVVDVTVRYENDSKALEMAWRGKSEEYKHLNAEVMEWMGSSEPKYFGFVMGTRGKWPGLNNSLMKFLGVEEFETFSQKTSRLTLSLTLEVL